MRLKKIKLIMLYLLLLMSFSLTLRALPPTNNYCPKIAAPRENCTKHTSQSGHDIWACEAAGAEDECKISPE